MIIYLDKSIYSKDVLLKTAYSFTEKAYLHLSHNEDSWIVEWSTMEGQVISPELFENELISQQLREKLLDETAEIRKIMLARAFASSLISNSPQNHEENRNPDETEDSSEVDEEILKGWFQQHDRI